MSEAQWVGKGDPLGGKVGWLVGPECGVGRQHVRIRMDPQCWDRD